MKAIVTGAAGFIGSHLCEELVRKGYDVVGIDCFLDYYPRVIKENNLKNLRTMSNFVFLEEDIRKAPWKQLLDGADFVFHLAAQAGVRASWSKNFVVYTTNNIEGTQILLEEARDVPLKKLVYASTSSVYGDTEDIPMQENSVLKPVSPYGVTKLAAEHLCYLYWKNFGIPSVSIRYFTVYGPRQRPDMAFYRFMLTALRGRPVTIFDDGRQTRDFTFIDDIIRGTILAAANGKEGKSYNLGGGSRISVNEVMKLLEEVTATPIHFRFIEKQKGDMKHTFASTAEASKDFDYTPSVSLTEGLAEEWKWLKELFDRGEAYDM